jgi:uncharacterized protein (DUF488 family)
VAGPSSADVLYTVGHGTSTAEELVALLRGGGVESVVDIRRFPGSRRHPHHSREALERSLPEQGLGYRWEERLGGRRRRAPDSPHVALRNDAFRAYADHMATAGFRAALDEVLTEASGTPTAVMCSESVWWRCHRRLVADAAQLLHRVEVRHLMHASRPRPHRPTEGVRVEDGRLVYDLGADRPLLGESTPSSSDELR